ncbi:putative chromosome segregation protein [Zalerion maritima]|uniref:Structural maintenance of chromosomes protein n=1 Tax=Zalerion maritima TaxID=339359 RepID=A0AAD5RND8_9PEZI|nr:putative chromosome segregation protein [Zalerion maritima]
MYIKQIIIQGFKSYKDQVALEPFSPGTNVVVGRNGSGKSNFFAAIRFVLSDAYTSMAREERQGLLHEGTGSAVNVAYVEIIFDNADGRFPTDNKDVVIRRTISAKKDEYSLDRKVVTKQDVVKLLEMAGFSRSNPYYIVPQGRVTALTNMKESDRLNLLKEVAGTQVYEARRAESLRIMDDTNSKREKIDETLEYIKERLTELEEEKEELRGFQEKDRERRCLEYAYYHREQVDATERLEELESGRQDGVEEVEENRQAYIKGDKKIGKLDAEIRKLEEQLELLKKHHRDVVEDRRIASKGQAKIEMKQREISANQVNQEQTREEHSSELESVKEQIAAKEAELAQLRPEFEKRKAKEAETRQELDTAEGSQNRLLAKQARGNQFKTKADRDTYLKKEIQDLNNNLATQKANLMDANEEVTKTEETIKQLENEVKGIRGRIESWGGNSGQIQDKLHKAEEVLEKLQEEKKEVTRDLEQKDTIRDNLQRTKELAERELSKSMDGRTSKGLATIRRLKREHGLEGAYGTLAELMEVSDAYKVPVETVAGASLFHYVVDTSETATFIINELNKRQGGRVTLVPLDKVRGRKAKFPRQDDALPLISKIKYDDMYENAFQEVFGKTLLCNSLEKAAAYAAQHGVDCITPEGDTTNKRGAMSGGYVDPRRSRLDAVMAVSKVRGEFEQLETEMAGLRRDADVKNQEITRAMGDVRKLQQQLNQVVYGFGPLNHELEMKHAHVEQERESLEKTISRRDTIDKHMKDFNAKLSDFEAEVSTEFKKALTAGEEKQLDDLSSRVAELKKQWNELSRSRKQVGGRIKILEADLRNNLQRRLDALNQQAFEATAGDSGSGTLKEVDRELKKARKTLKEIDAKIRETEDRIESAEGSVSEHLNRKAEIEQTQNELLVTIKKQEKRIEKQAEKKALLTQRADEAAKSIRDLGVLPDEAFGKYERMESKTIESRMKKVTVALKKYKHVNKKAFEQYNNFTTEQDRLLNRRKELDESERSIEALVSHLDRCKDEAIERTFKQVSKEFANIFEKLVPAGHGRLVIQRRADRRGPQDEESENEDRGAVENYTGVGISVSFNSKVMDEQQKIQQLSGGQKSLCALCLIFALQATESSPMVIFDEVDANLDAQYRTAVAELLKSISREAGTQFICTTFRPEIVLVADKCYGVTFRQKSSEIQCVDTEDALSFVEGQKR